MKRNPLEKHGSDAKQVDVLDYYFCQCSSVTFLHNVFEVSNDSLSVNLKVPYQHCFDEDYETHNEMFL